MDCLEFRRLIGTDPRLSSTNPEARAHLDGCPRCADALTRAQAFETQLARAFAVAVPEGLADRVLFAQLTQERRRRRGGFRYGLIGLAAAACLAIVVGVVERGRGIAKPLSDLVVAHVFGEERPALDKRTLVAPDAVERAFADRGVRLQTVPAGITYVHECPVGDYRTVHMVMRENDRPISVIYVTQRRMPDASDFRSGAMRGREVPIADGTLVMLADSDARFDALAQEWRQAIEGSPEIAAGSP